MTRWGGNRRERTVEGKLRDLKGEGYVGVLLKTQVSRRPSLGQGQADEQQFTYVPAVTLGILLQVCSP